MGTLDPHLTPSEQVGGTGAGNSGKAGDEGAKFRAMKLGEVIQRLQAAKLLADIFTTLAVRCVEEPLLPLAIMAGVIAQDAGKALLPPKE